MTVSNGQWVGRFKGTNDGIAILELDDRGNKLEGTMLAFDNDRRNPSLAARVSIGKGLSRISFTSDADALHPSKPSFLDLKEFPDVDFTQKLSVDMEFDGQQLSGTWTGTNDTKGTMALELSKAHLPTELQPVSGVATWEEFQDYVKERRFRKFEHPG